MQYNNIWHVFVSQKVLLIFCAVNMLCLKRNLSWVFVSLTKRPFLGKSIVCWTVAFLEKCLRAGKNVNMTYIFRGLFPVKEIVFKHYPSGIWGFVTLTKNVWLSIFLDFSFPQWQCHTPPVFKHFEQILFGKFPKMSMVLAPCG